MLNVKQDMAIQETEFSEGFLLFLEHSTPGSNIENLISTNEMIA
jgi:hypothetical protein